MLADIEVQSHVLLLEDLVLNLLLIDLLEDLLDVVLGLLEDSLLLHVLYVYSLHLHVDFTQLCVPLTYFTDYILGSDLVVAGQGLDFFLLCFEAKYLSLVFLHLHP